MLYKIFCEIDNLNIQIKIKNKKLSLIYEEGTLPLELKKAIKEHKYEIMKRLEENEMARAKGFLIYRYGELYEYRYGLGAYLFIEREGDLAIAWRANYMPEEKQPYKIKMLAERVTFEKAFQEAENFINWLQRQKRGVKGA
ncbi:hypothetical protein HPK10_02055 [Anoxybacillus flavithermus]|uniref:hypothetical protein n=1 Tax=Anoxybacillus flavithermus TaxID=33934 RepID=UPI001867F630|nr:hypothetical protein [Anoxybacillus flavithermus]MBE2941941.1 hypothetical protein [Anoxybacillus flavithermus]MBE2950179.1 hypothetical protein [Anoxybacillus flavithermus]MBE2953024.1 hypothetical protein [Anoxybacillus flavithermus]MBE2958377.1 hypothetical protein [Anoxybacillus flavithermus]